MPATYEKTFKATNRTSFLERLGAYFAKQGIPVKKSNNSWSAKTSTSAWSWGENITIFFLEDDLIKVTSACSIPTQIIDWGKNRRNVEKIYDLAEG